MLSIEEIKLLIEKLEKVKKEDFQKLIDSNLKILKDIELAVDANNQEEINRLDKTVEWFKADINKKQKQPLDDILYKHVHYKIFAFARSNLHNSLEIGPGNGMFSKEFRAWRLNYFLDVLGTAEKRVRPLFKPAHQKYLKFCLTKKHECTNIPQNSCSFVFSWDTFVFFTQNHIQHYLHDLKRVMLPGGYAFIQYADCQYDADLHYAKRGYWNYNTKSAMEKMIKDEGYTVIEMSSFGPRANYTIFQKPGNENPIVYKIHEIDID